MTEDRTRLSSIKASSILALAVLTLFLLAPAASTSVAQTDVPSSGTQTVISPGSDNTKVFQFKVNDGGDKPIYGEPQPGTALYEFQDNESVFLNHSNPPVGVNKGVNGYDAGDDIVKMARHHTAGTNNSINGKLMGNFSSRTLYLDGGVGANDNSFQGDGGTGSNSELIIRDNDTPYGYINKKDYVVSTGYADLQSFGVDVYFTDPDGPESSHDYNEGQAIVRDDGGSPGTLEKADTVLKGGDAGIDTFEDLVVSFTDDDGDGNYEQDAVVANGGSNDNLLEPGDNILTSGSAALVMAYNSNLTYFNSTDSSTPFFDDSGEPIYFENTSDGFVNISEDVRVGQVNITSRNDSRAGNMDLSLESLSYVYNETSNTSDNDVWKPLENPVATKTGYSGDGSFYVLEFNESGGVNADNTWNPNSGDQDVLIYDLDSAGDSVSTGEVLIYNSDPFNGNVSISPGEEFNSTTIASTNTPSNTYQPASDVGFSDNGDGSFNPGDDNVTVNISQGGSWGMVNLAPSTATPSAGYSGTFISQGKVMVWDVNNGTGDSVWNDGLYVDMDSNSNVTEGDVRLGHWTDEESPGQVIKGDLDLQANLTGFLSGDNVAYVDDDNDGDYTPGNGKATDSGGREAIISTSDLQIQSLDSVVRSGFAALTDFNNSVTYVDDDASGAYNDGEAILNDRGGNPIQLEIGDEVLLEGQANLRSFVSEVKFLEDGNQAGFEQGSSEAIFFDANDNNFVGDSRGAGAPLEPSGDHVIVSGTADMNTVSQPPDQVGENGLAYVDSNSNGNYSAGEDVLNITLVENGSTSVVNGTRIYNFADSTRHAGGSTYSSGDNILNDTDQNFVYLDVFKSLGIENIVSRSPPDTSYFTKLASNDLRNGLELYVNTSGAGFDPAQDKMVATLTDQDGNQLTWNATTFEENITSDETFYLVMDVKTRSNLGEKAYVMRADSVNMEFTSRIDVSPENQFRQIVDAHPPEVKKVETGDRKDGDSMNQSAIFVTIDEYYGGIASSEVSRSDFNLDMPGVGVVSADLGTVSNIFSAKLQLNNTIQTNSTPQVEMNGTIRDFYGNEFTNSGFITAQDGLEPKIERVRYRDENVDGTIDKIDIFFTENVTYSTFSGQNWNITDRNLTGIEIDNGTETNNYMIEFNASAAPGITGVKNESIEPALNFSAAFNPLGDGSGNTLSSVANITLQDEAAPAIVAAKTDDRNLDARIDVINVNFSERLNDFKSYYNPAFSLSSGSIDSVETNTRNDSRLEFDVSDVGFTGATPNITMSAGEVYDDEPNTANNDQVFSGLVDSARPVLMNAEIDHVNSNRTETFVSLNFSERVRDPNDQASTSFTLRRENFSFYGNGWNSTHSVDLNYTLNTGNYPNITELNGIKDTDGNLAYTLEENITVRTVRIPLHKGWNFVSFPIADESSHAVSEMMNESKVEVIWTYYNGAWKTYDPEAPSNDFSQLEGGRGYMINATESQTLEVNVNNLKGTIEPGDLSEMSVTVGNGWNLIGQFQEFNQDPDYNGAFYSIDGAGVKSVVGPKYDNGSKIMDFSTPLRDDNKTVYSKMSPGHGYWMWMSDGGTATYREPIIGSGG